MDKIPKQFWAEWYKFYRAGDHMAMEEHMSKTLLGRLQPTAVSMLNDFVIDLVEYLETRKKVKK